MNLRGIFDLSHHIIKLESIFNTDGMKTKGYFIYEQYF